MLERRLIDSLYVDAMVLADEARAYFDLAAREGSDIEGWAALDRVLFSCESLKVTTRLMHIIAWLLTQRAVDAGELAPDHAREPSRRLGPAIVSDEATLARLPDDAQALIASTIDLYRRVERLDTGLGDQPAPSSPARHLLHRLQRSF